MITAERIIEQQFGKSVLGGFKCNEVDMFLEEIARDVKAMSDENIELKKKLSVLAARIEDYKRDEDYLKNAILNSQKLSEITGKEAEANAKQLQHDAKSEAEKLISDAKNNAERLLSEAKTRTEYALEEAEKKHHLQIKKMEEEYLLQKYKNDREIKHQQEIVKKIKDEIGSFKTSLLVAYRNHVELITKLPELSISEYVVEELPKMITPEKQEDIENHEQENNNGITFVNEELDSEETKVLLSDDDSTALTDDLEDVISVDFEVGNSEKDSFVEKKSNPINIPQSIKADEEFGQFDTKKGDSFFDKSENEKNSKDETITFDKIQIPQEKIKPDKPKNREFLFKQINLNIEKDNILVIDSNKNKDEKSSKKDEIHKGDIKDEEDDNKFKNLKFGVDYDIFHDDDEDEEDLDNKIFQKRK